MTLFDTLKVKAATMTDDQLRAEYHWINPSHLDLLLSEIRAQS